MRREAIKIVEYEKRPSRGESLEDLKRIRNALEKMQGYREFRDVRQDLNIASAALIEAERKLA